MAGSFRNFFVHAFAAAAAAADVSTTLPVRNSEQSWGDWFDYDLSCPYASSFSQLGSPSTLPPSFAMCSHLGQGLDRFAQFFICPLISSDGLEREVKAVVCGCSVLGTIMAGVAFAWTSYSLHGHLMSSKRCHCNENF